MEIERSGSQRSGKGPVDWFTGTVRIDPLFDAPDPARVAVHPQELGFCAAAIAGSVGLLDEEGLCLRMRSIRALFGGHRFRDRPQHRSCRRSFLAPSSWPATRTT
jgi:hypothetical protein